MLAQLMRFGMVGIIGTLLNIGVFTLVVSVLSLNHNLGAVLAFLVAVTHNYAVNRVWTFAESGMSHGLFALGWAKYVAVNLLGFGVNLLVLNAVSLSWGPRFNVLGQVIGILAGMGFNFLLSRHFLFNRSKRVG